MKIPISFKKSEKELYDFLSKKRSPSNYVKDLLEKEMLKEKGSTKNDTSYTQDYNNPYDF
jgi:hypothetical protein